jgi:uncharacterized DUF497 family protein
LETRFTWDAAKARRNRRLHGVSFRVAAGIFADPFIVVQENIEDDSEQRYHAIGMTGSTALLLVVFVDRSEADLEIIRIVSARKANDYEQSAYQDQFR